MDQAPVPDMEITNHGVEPPGPAANNEALSPNCLQMLKLVNELLSNAAGTTERLSCHLGEQSQSLSQNVVSLRKSRSKDEILGLITLIAHQAESLHASVEASNKELLQTKQSMAAMQTELSQARQLLNEDALTGALNRRGLEQTLAREIARARRYKSQLTVVMLDLDHFKKINDAHGHSTGDAMLTHFTGLVKSVMRETDALVRYGGEEFALIMPETDGRGAHFVAGRLQQRMSKTPLHQDGKAINTTFSAGIASLHQDECGNDLLKRADEALYAAKHAGRNTIKTAPSVSEHMRPRGNVPGTLNQASGAAV